MWKPGHVTIIWSFTACYRDSFTLFFAVVTYEDDKMTCVTGFNSVCRDLSVLYHKVTNYTRSHKYRRNYVKYTFNLQMSSKYSSDTLYVLFRMWHEVLLHNGPFVCSPLNFPYTVDAVGCVAVKNILRLQCQPKLANGCPIFSYSNLI
jgi:hypothetical protein